MKLLLNFLILILQLHQNIIHLPRLIDSLREFTFLVPQTLKHLLNLFGTLDMVIQNLIILSLTKDTKLVDQLISNTLKGAHAKPLQLHRTINLTPLKIPMVKILLGLLLHQPINVIS